MSNAKKIALLFMIGVGSTFFTSAYHWGVQLPFCSFLLILNKNLCSPSARISPHNSINEQINQITIQMGAQ